MSVSNKLRVIANPTELALVARITAVLFTLPPALKLMNIDRIVRMLTPGRTRTPPDGLTPERVTYLCLRVLGFFGRFSYRASCLRKCLLLFHCLRYYGNAVVIHFGVKSGGGELLGHCWLTLEGALYNDHAEMVDQFTRMFSLPRPTATAGDPPGREDKRPDLKTVSFDA
jgi:Transglutaminase-like superfamily